MRNELTKEIREAFDSIGFKDSSLYAASEVEITWQPANPDVPGDPVTNFHVHHHLEAARGMGSREDMAASRALGCTSGRPYLDWMTVPGHTPEGILANFMLDGQMPRGEHLLQMLLQFSKIGECGWARVMAAQLILDKEEE